MASSPIRIPSSGSSWKSRHHTTLSSSPSGSESSLYVPVHKRAPSSTTSSSFEDEREHDFTSPEHAVYSIATLLSLQHSPASKLPKEERDSLRAAFPEIIMNRRQRKYQQYVALHGVPTTSHHHHDQHHDEARARPVSPPSPTSSSFSSSSSRQSRHHNTPSRTHSTSPHRKPRVLPRESSDNWRVRI